MLNEKNTISTIKVNTKNAKNNYSIIKNKFKLQKSKSQLSLALPKIGNLKQQA